MKIVIMITVIVCAGFVLFAGILQSKYYDKIYSKRIEKEAEALVFLVLATSTLVSIPGINAFVQISAYGVLLFIIYSLLKNADDFMKSLLQQKRFKYKKQEMYAQQTLRITSILYIIDVIAFLIFCCC